MTLGYHAYDNCFQFETQWKRMKENEMDALSFIWTVYSYHLNRALNVPTKLEQWAIDIARPYLLNNLPSALTPDTTDPRSASLNYEEPDFMDFDNIVDSKLPAAVDWQLLGGKHKRRINKEATQATLPASPSRHNPSVSHTAIPLTTGRVDTSEGAFC